MAHNSNNMFSVSNTGASQKKMGETEFSQLPPLHAQKATDDKSGDPGNDPNEMNKGGL